MIMGDFEKFFYLLGGILVFSLVYYFFALIFMRKNKVHVKMLFSIGIAFGTAFITRFITNPYSIGLKVKMGIPIPFYFPNAEILAKLTGESAFALDQFFLNAAAWTAIYFFLAFFFTGKKR